MAIPARPKLFPISLRMALILPYVALIIATAGVSGYISFTNGQQAVNEVAQQMRNELIARVETHLRSFLDAPRRINEFNENLIAQGMLAPTDVEALQKHFLEMVKISPTITSVYLGNAEGGIIGSGREGAGGAYYVYNTENFRAGTFRKYGVGAQDAPTMLLTSIPNFDARTRPWFSGAVNKAAETWSEIYILFTGQDMAIAASRPIYAASGQLLGVVSVDVFLSQISQDLQAMEIPSNGNIFIVDQAGFLVAASKNEPMFSSPTQGGTLARIPARDSQTPVIRGAAGFLQDKYGDNFSALPASGQLLELELAGERQFIQVLPFIENGIRWVIVVVVPEAAFMDKVNANNRWAVMVTFLATFLAVLLSIFVASRVTDRISQLSEAAQAMARSEWGNQIQVESQIIELKGLEASFNQMQNQIHSTLKQLTNEIHERKLSDAALRESEARFRSVIQQSQEGFDLIDEHGKIIEWNQGMEQITGIPAAEALGQPIWELQYRMAPEEAHTNTLLAELQASTQNALQTRQAPWLNSLSSGEIQRADGTRRFVMINIYSVSFEDKFMIGGAMHDITEEKHALQEKETLLRELYHRTKNNMQVISSLLALEQDFTTNPEVLMLVNEMRYRIDSMAMVHEKLYQSRNLSSIDLAEYIRSLAGLLKESYAVNSRVELRFELENIPVLIDTAIPCGLIMNELISNAIKYAFPVDRQGEILIALKRGADQEIRMIVADNGIGFPADFDPRKDGKLGTETIFALGEMQLQGTVEFHTGAGVTCQVTFSDSLYSPRI